MIRDPESFNILLDTLTRFVREKLIPREAEVTETDEIPADIVDWVCPSTHHLRGQFLILLNTRAASSGDTSDAGRTFGIVHPPSSGATSLPI